MKEHSGGAPDVGYIPFDSWDEQAVAVPIQHFDYAALDKPEDFIIEAVKKGEDIKPLLAAIIERSSALRCAVKISCLIALIIEAKQPRMVAHQLMWATGMTTMDGEPGAQLAKRYGVSKQAFQQGADRICEKLELKPCRNMRDEKARQNMSKRNYRK